MKRRRLALITIAVASLGLAAGTSAFTTMSADRGVDVRVAGDSNAYIEIDDKNLQCGNSSENKLLENNLETTVDIVVEVKVPADADKSLKIKPKGDSEKPIELGPGNSKTLNFGGYETNDGPVLHIGPVNGTTPDTIDIGVEATSDSGVSISLDDREYYVNYAQDTETGTENTSET